mmetsp:Transcript_18143/g.49779  ORF Transcript_18143/g.49779 Transcript_18143/m.49779 type:complete len:297 (-) Transcript_18143:1253-2143(-)
MVMRRLRRPRVEVTDVWVEKVGFFGRVRVRGPHAVRPEDFRAMKIIAIPECPYNARQVDVALQKELQGHLVKVARDPMPNHAGPFEDHHVTHRSKHLIWSRAIVDACDQHPNQAVDAVRWSACICSGRQRQNRLGPMDAMVLLFEEMEEGARSVTKSMDEATGGLAEVQAMREGTREVEAWNAQCLVLCVDGGVLAAFDRLQRHRRIEDSLFHDPSEAANDGIHRVTQGEVRGDSPDVGERVCEVWIPAQQVRVYNQLLVFRLAEVLVDNAKLLPFGNGSNGNPVMFLVVLDESAI